MKTGSLTVVGIGIQPIRQTTPETVYEMQQAEKLFYLPFDTVTVKWFRELNPTAESLASSFIEGHSYQYIHDEWIENILTYVRSGLRVCVALHGHPSIFSSAGYEAVQKARQEGYSTVMLPAISAENSLFSLLGISPQNGFQSYDATDFLLSKRLIDVRSSLILWNVGLLGQTVYQHSYSNNANSLLVEILQSYYSLDHVVTVYEASASPICKPRVENICLGVLTEVQLGVYSILYIPPLYQADISIELKERLSLLINSTQLERDFYSHEPTSSTILRKFSLPEVWSERLKQDGFFTCNIGFCSDNDLQAIAIEISALEQHLTVGSMSIVKSYSSTEYQTLTSQSVPFHNDGLSRDLPPRYLLLYCSNPPSKGGETLLVRGEDIICRMSLKLRKFLEENPVRIHLAGRSTTRYLLSNYPGNSSTIFLFIDPATTTNCSLTVAGRLLDDWVLEELRDLLSDPSIIYHSQKWMINDLLLIDNYQVLHGRTAYQGDRSLKHIPIYPSASTSNTSSTSCGFTYRS